VDILTGKDLVEKLKKYKNDIDLLNIHLKKIVKSLEAEIIELIGKMDDEEILKILYISSTRDYVPLLKFEEIARLIDKLIPEDMVKNITTSSYQKCVSAAFREYRNNEIPKKVESFIHKKVALDPNIRIECKWFINDLVVIRTTLLDEGCVENQFMKFDDTNDETNDETNDDTNDDAYDKTNDETDKNPGDKTNKELNQAGDINLQSFGDHFSIIDNC
jgi:hypothetical protein